MLSNMDEIKVLEHEILHLKNKLQEKERRLNELKCNHQSENYDATKLSSQPYLTVLGGLPQWAVERYSRQLLVEALGVAGTQRLCKASVLLVGAGGLGSPCALYLAGAGIGHLGIVDSEKVDITNLHRQVLHTECTVGKKKVESAVESIHRLNSRIKVTPYNIHLNSSNALEVLSPYDIVVDGSDNVATRYLLSDACALLRKPLVSASALHTHGQLTIYNYRNGEEQGPCYRCVFPKPPPPETVGSCAEAGVLGPLVGVLGCLQALEVIKLVNKLPSSSLMVGRLLILDVEDMVFRNVKLRQRDPNCCVCSSNPTLTTLIDYEQFCNAKATDKDTELQLLDKAQRLSAQEVQQHGADSKHLLVDVRPTPEFHMCHLDGSINYPHFLQDNNDVNQLNEFVQKTGVEEVIFICRRGNDSQLAVQKYQAAVCEAGVRVRDVRGGLHAWAHTVDSSFPIY